MARSRSATANERVLRRLNLGLATTEQIPRKSTFLRKHHNALLGASFAGGAFSVNRLDMIRFEPMGQKIPFSAVALGAAILGALILNHFKKRPQAELVAGVAAGVATGMVLKKAAERSGAR